MSEDLSFDLFPESSVLYKRQNTPKKFENNDAFQLRNESFSESKASFSPLEMHQIRARLSLSPTYNKIKREAEGNNSFQNSSYSSPYLEEKKVDSFEDGEDYYSTSRVVIHDLRKRLVEAEKEIEILDSKKEAKKRVSNILLRSERYSPQSSPSVVSYQSPRYTSNNSPRYNSISSPRYGSNSSPRYSSSHQSPSPSLSSPSQYQSSHSPLSKRASSIGFHSPSTSISITTRDTLSPDRSVSASPAKQHGTELDDLDIEDLKRSVFSIKRQNQKLKAAVTGLVDGHAKSHDSQVAVLESAIIERDKKLAEQEKKIHQIFQLLKESENHQASLAHTVEDLKKETERSEAVLKQRSVQLEKSKDKIKQLRTLALSPRKDPRSELELSKWKEGYSQLHSTLVHLKQELVNNEKSLKDHVHLRENQLKQKIKETKLEEDRLNSGF
eukprot:TRINITY_DN362_c0_g1_i1.p1 TRINITY_DN362_c0_g1~~TRINITY_DN362_c0_g1_i1.p1  ORF type:complete len:441 (+),score=95.40 TRINITY_DN362_c0_g1_i1:150-1472(+)